MERPDGNKGHDPNLIADVNIRTAETIKRVIPDARIAAGVLCSPNSKKTEDWLKRVTELKKERLFTWFTYHAYTHNPDKGHYENVERLKALIAQYAPHIKLWQGEAGVESETCVHGAMSQYPWTELKQAKWVARRMLGDLGHDVWSSVSTRSLPNATMTMIDASPLDCSDDVTSVVWSAAPLTAGECGFGVR